MPLGRYLMSQFARPHGLPGQLEALLADAGFEQVTARSHGDGARGDFIVIRAAAP